MYLINETKCKFNLIFSLRNEIRTSGVRSVKRLGKLSNSIDLVLQGFFHRLY
jgi:hypothetical protein